MKSRLRQGGWPRAQLCPVAQYATRGAASRSLQRPDGAVPRSVRRPARRRPVRPGRRFGRPILLGLIAVAARRARTWRGGRVVDADLPRAAGDRGSGTLWMLGLIGLIWSVAVMAMTVGGVRVARHRAYAAADLAALAAASHAADGSRSACRLAARIAQGSGGQLRRCVVRGRVSEVTVVSGLPHLPGLGRLNASARARAGPVTAPGACDPPMPCEGSRSSSGVPRPSPGVAR